MAKTETLSFPVEPETKDELDKIILHMQVEGELPSGTSRSEVLRMALEEWIEGNVHSSTAILTMPN